MGTSLYVTQIEEVMPIFGPLPSTSISLSYPGRHSGNTGLAWRLNRYSEREIVRGAFHSPEIETFLIFSRTTGRVSRILEAFQIRRKAQRGEDEPLRTVMKVSDKRGAGRDTLLLDYHEKWRLSCQATFTTIVTCAF